jgi:hypothetical protein
MSFYLTLPLLRGWRYYYMRYPQLGAGILKHGAVAEVANVTGKGYLLFAAARLWNSGDGKYVELHADFDYPEWTYPIHFSIDSLQAFGDTLPINYGAYATVIDDTNKVYAAAITPSNPMPFSKNFKVTLIAPSQPIVDSNDIVYVVVYGYVLITDEEAFKESVRELYGITDLTEAIRELASAIRMLQSPVKVVAPVR